jgi:putative acetyltransferase
VGVGQSREEFRYVTDKVLIRSETSADVSAIAEVTVAAFKTLAISNHTEQFIIAALRAAKALTVSLVAEVDGRVVGHIAFSPLTISDGSPNWYGLGPVSVLPECQRRGIGSALIQEGISRLKDLGARTSGGLSMREYRKRSSSPCLWTAIFRRASLSFTWDSKRTANTH